MNRTLLLSVLLITMGCATSNFTSTSDLKYPEYKGAVKVFFNEPKEITYDEIGIVAAEGALFSDDVEVIKSLQNKAAKEGANAIIIIPKFSGNTIKTGDRDSEIYISTKNERKILAVAIRIKDK